MLTVEISSCTSRTYVFQEALLPAVHLEGPNALQELVGHLDAPICRVVDSVAVRPDLRLKVRLERKRDHHHPQADESRRPNHEVEKDDAAQDLVDAAPQHLRRHFHVHTDFHHVQLHVAVFQSSAHQTTVCVCEQIANDVPRA